VERASRIFGSVSSPLLNASNLTKLADDLQARAKQSYESCQRLVDELTNCLTAFDPMKEKAPRLQTAEAVLEFLDGARSAKPAALIESLANLKPTTSESAMGSSFASASEVVSALTATQWKLFDSIRQLHDDRVVAANALLRRVADALCSDQLVAALPPVLRIEQSKAIDLLTPPAKPQATVTPVPEPPPVAPPTKPGKKVIDRGVRENLTVAQASDEIERLRQKAKGSQVARINVSWLIEE